MQHHHAADADCGSAVMQPVAFAIWKMGGFLWPMLMPSHSQVGPCRFKLCVSIHLATSFRHESQRADAQQEAEETPDERRKRDKKQSKAERAEKRGKMKVRR